MEVKGRFTLRNYPMGQTHHTLLGKEEVLKKKKKKKEEVLDSGRSSRASISELRERGA